MEILQKLKDDLKKDVNFELVFYKTSKDLMNNYVLNIANNDIELCEIEFYYYAENHQDEKTLKNEKQKTTAQMFFHEFGIDLTFGDASCYGGILLRGIKHNGKYIAGPQNVSEYLQEQIQDLQNQPLNFKGVSFNDTVLHSIRVMGDKTNQEFAKKLYRFAKENYLNGSPSKEFIKKSLPEISYFKVVSHLTGIYDFTYNSDAKSALEVIKQDSKFMNNIENFKCSM